MQSIFHYNWLLSQTVTSRLLVADTPAEAVENIILHTDKVLVFNKENVIDNLNLIVLLLPRIHRYWNACRSYIIYRSWVSKRIPNVFELKFAK